MKGTLTTREAVMASVTEEYNRKAKNGQGLRLAWIEKAVNDAADAVITLNQIETICKAQNMRLVPAGKQPSLKKRSQLERLTVANAILSEIWGEFLAGQIDEDIGQAAVNCQTNVNRIVWKINELWNRREGK